jgi:hypothetical protein
MILEKVRDFGKRRRLFKGNVWLPLMTEKEQMFAKMLAIVQINEYNGI